jgi:LDH2 family malate/lactate/ureidoglycolate dehydrogenase
VCLPFGGIKGSALAMLMDILAGVLTGAKFGGDVNSLYFDHTEPQNVGHLFIAMKPDLFMSREEYDERMDTFVDRVKKLPRAADVEEILIPGEPEERTAAIRARTGLPITPQVEKTLRDEAGAAGLTFPQGSETPL